ncbi:hypothetical protein [Qipengyuania aquimaris]|uniref:hypothetical protein n=1 Tax=Qipengyuania aquimaris TaxID=255984 RepID=UPI001FD4B910|nr:hypothetical protein [Qipengyuania aquimaris]UOR16013.1 hypothetical protein LCM05_02945 [Qipengyuania aquimaris]
MGKKLHSNGKGRFAPAMLAVAGLAFAMPAAVLAVGAPDTSNAAPGAIEYLPFTPAGADPQLARRVAEVIGEDALRFTPASKPRQSTERTVNFAVRVDDATARTMSGGNLSEKVALATPEAISPIAGTRYNLGIARGFQSFAQPSRAVSSASVTAGVREDLRDIAMPDLSTYESGEDKGKPSRFQSRIALEQRDRAGSSPNTLQGVGSQRVDLGGSYRLSRNLDVTAGVRLSQERDRLAPLTDGVEDDQAVYVGTQIRF